jgi:hypothetical protein
MSEWANERMSEWANERMSEWANERMSEWANGEFADSSFVNSLIRDSLIRIHSPVPDLG